MKLYQELNNKLNVLCSAKYCIAFSYSTVIGIRDKRNNIAYISLKKWGVTSGKHRNLFVKDYCDGIKIEYLEQEKLEELADNLGI